MCLLYSLQRLTSFWKSCISKSNFSWTWLHYQAQVNYNALQYADGKYRSVGATASFMFLPPSLKTHEEFYVYKAVPHTGWGGVPGSIGTWNNNKAQPVGYLSFNSIGVEITILFLLFITPRLCSSFWRPLFQNISYWATVFLLRPLLR